MVPAFSVSRGEHVCLKAPKVWGPAFAQLLCKNIESENGGKVSAPMDGVDSRRETKFRWLGKTLSAFGWSKPLTTTEWLAIEANLNLFDARKRLATLGVWPDVPMDSLGGSLPRAINLERHIALGCNVIIYSTQGCDLKVGEMIRNRVEAELPCIAAICIASPAIHRDRVEWNCPSGCTEISLVDDAELLRNTPDEHTVEGSREAALKLLNSNRRTNP